MSLFAKIAPAVPIDRQAAMVTSRGERYEPAKRIDQVHSDMPLPVLSDREKAVRSKHISDFIDLTGRAFGRMRVIGVYAGNPGNELGRWIVRCVCGNYETRKRKAILNPRNDIDCCDHCRHLKHLRRRAEFIAYGKEIGR